MNTSAPTEVPSRLNAANESRALEEPVVIHCGADQMIGILHTANVANLETFRGTACVFVVGGPQYRAGSHRMFVDLARRFAAAGIVCLRFDVRGMGDSGGDFVREFDQIHDDLAAAVDFTRRRMPLATLSMFGLCDGAAAASMFASVDSRIHQAVLLNPWVRTQAGQARATISVYYLKRVLQRDFWRGAFSGRVNLLLAGIDFLRTLLHSRRTNKSATDMTNGEYGNFIDKMSQGIGRIAGPILILLSEDDVVAKEFADLTERDKQWHLVIHRPNVEQIGLPGADHTLSGEGELSAMADVTIDWFRRQADCP